MNFRFEDKLKLDKNKIFEFDEWLLKNNITQSFPSREIYSIYFDNPHLCNFLYFPYLLILSQEHSLLYLDLRMILLFQKDHRTL